VLSEDTPEDGAGDTGYAEHGHDDTCVDYTYPVSLIPRITIGCIIPDFKEVF
jgi:hypothetical protein